MWKEACGGIKDDDGAVRYGLADAVVSPLYVGVGGEVGLGYLGFDGRSSDDWLRLRGIQ